LTNSTKNDQRYVHLDTVTDHKCDRQTDRWTEQLQHTPQLHVS